MLEIHHNSLVTYGQSLQYIREISKSEGAKCHRADASLNTAPPVFNLGLNHFKDGEDFVGPCLKVPEQNQAPNVKHLLSLLGSGLTTMQKRPHKPSYPGTCCPKWCVILALEDESKNEQTTAPNTSA